MKLGGNIVAITGGTSGIGLALAERFHANGNRVIICGRRKDRLAAIAKSLPGLAAYECDVADAASRAAFFALIKERHPDCNVLVNNAGVQMAGPLAAGLDIAKVEAEVGTNLVGLIHLSDLFSRFLAGKKDAAILNVSSGLAFAPLAFLPVYCATKAAVHSFTFSLRMLLEPAKIEVIEIIPPAVDTELGSDRRPAGGASHGGMALPEFVEAVWKGLEAGQAEIAVGGAIDLRARGEAASLAMNRR